MCYWSAGPPGRTGSPHSPVLWHSCRCCCTTHRCTASWSAPAAARRWTEPLTRWRAYNNRWVHLNIPVLWNVPMKWSLLSKLKHSQRGFSFFRMKRSMIYARKEDICLTTSCPHWLECCERSVVGKHTSRQFLDPSGWWLPLCSEPQSLCF